MERRRREVLGLLAALSIVAAACGGASSTATPSPSLPAASKAPDSRLLTRGLGANLDKLTSYRFTEMIYSGASGAPAGSAAPSSSAGSSAGSSPGSSSSSPSRAASPSSTGSGGSGGTALASLRIDGTVVNGTGKSIAISVGGVRYIVVGSSAWSSVDGDVWASVDALADVMTLLPSAYYDIWFDAHVSGFSAIADETHNNVACTRFSGSGALGNLYASMTGQTFQADLWIAKDGGYPMGGRYLVPVDGRVSGFSFEITNVNDQANAVPAPTNVIALPS